MKRRVGKIVLPYRRRAGTARDDFAHAVRSSSAPLPTLHRADEVIE